MPLVREQARRGFPDVPPPPSRALFRGTLLLTGVLLVTICVRCALHAWTTQRPMRLGPYVLLGPRYDYSNTILIRFGKAGPGITGDWVEDNATWNGKRFRVSGRPIFVDAGGFMLLRE